MAFPMVKVALALCLALAGLSGASAMGAGSQAVMVGDEQNGGEVNLQTGQVLTIKLEGNAGTAYQWLLADPQTGPLELQGEPAWVEGEAKLLGGKGHYEFNFKAVEAGEMELILEYRRGWEQKPAAKTFTLTVFVR